ncbi:MAG TPA: CPBP family intramembrane glutamic endopeptidase [Terracidiphilus sp.]|jgi:hypothetical protein
MTTPPEFDPLNEEALAPADEQPALPADDEEIPSLEGMVFSPFLDPADLAGADWDADQSLPALPIVEWDGPLRPEDALVHAPVPVSPDSQPAEVAFVERRKTPRPTMDWLQPPEKIAEKITPLGRPAVKKVDPGLYGNLADSSWIAMDRLQPVHGSPEEDATDPTPLKAVEDAIQVGPVLNGGAAAEIEPANATETAGEETQTLLSMPEADSGQSEIAAGPYLPKLLTDGAGEDELQGEELRGKELRDGEPQDGELEAEYFEPAPAIRFERTLFRSFNDPRPPRSWSVRIPNFGHLALLLLLACGGLLSAGLLAQAALHFHLWGISSAQKAATDVHYTIGSMAALYLVTFGAALLIFPLVWHKNFFAGLQWNAFKALHSFRTLVGAACVCFVLALVDEVLLPGPANAPIDKLFDSRTAAWLLFVFGVTFAPFFEEIIFRGFLLPALCTAYDWFSEKASGNSALPLDPNGHPQWSLGAMIFASVATSIPFALMHAEQTAWSLGPFLLLVAVSLVLCWARLATRSLAASVLVHASYNFLLFSLMLLGTSGFRHLDKM